MASLPPPALQNAGRWLRAKGNVNFSLLIGLTGSASLPAAQILERVSYAWQHLQKTAVPPQWQGNKGKTSQKSGSSWQKAAKPRACEMKFVLIAEAMLNLLRLILVSGETE